MHTFVFVLYFNLTLLYFKNDIARNAEKISKGIGINAWSLKFNYKIFIFLDSFPPSNSALLLDVNVLRERETQRERERDLKKSKIISDSIKCWCIKVCYQLMDFLKELFMAADPGYYNYFIWTIFVVKDVWKYVFLTRFQWQLFFLINFRIFCLSKSSVRYFISLLILWSFVI